MIRSAFVALFLITSMIFISPTAVQADGEYQITIENGEIEIPEQTRTVNGEEFTATSIGFVDPGKQIDARVTASTDDPYDILLYDRDKNREDARFSATGETTAAFDTGNLDPGSYIISVRTDQSEAIQPVIIQAYETTVSLPAEIENGNSVTADIATQKYNGVDAPAIGKVELVVVDATTGAVVERTPAKKTEQFEYTASINPEYDPGEYQVYTAVYEDNGAEDGTLDLISVSDRHKITVSEKTDEKNSVDDSEDTSEDEEISESQDSEDTGGSSDTSSTNETDTNTEGDNTNTEGDNTNTTDLNETNNGEVSNGSEVSNDESDSTVSDSDSDDQVIEPSEPSTGSDTSSETVPLNGLRLIAVMVLSVAVGARIRNKN